MSSTLLLSEIQEAERRLDLAREQLSGVLGEIGALPRADKTMMSAPVEEALDQITLARTKLRELRLLLPGDGA